jgi:hypothetical protein
MNPESILLPQRQHLANLLEAIQRCIFFLEASDTSIEWPLTAEILAARKKDKKLFEALAAINERFSKLQDTLGAAMRHSLVLSGEQADSFIKVLAIFEKFQIITSIDDWQIARTARNLAAHDYETDYEVVAEHFNALHDLKRTQYQTAKRFLAYCQSQLSVTPLSQDFSDEFLEITRQV